MVANLNGKTAALLFCIVLPFFAAWATEAAVDEETASRDSQADTAALVVTPRLQLELTQLAYNFATAVELTAAGDAEGALEAAKAALADDADTVAELPPAWDHLNFTITGGPAAHVQFGLNFYSTLGITRVQQMVSNVVVKKTGATTAVMRYYIFATEVYPDEHALHGTITVVSDVRLINGRWKMTHRAMTVTSITESPAWTGAPPAP
jgi:hypothetical protein